MSELTNKSHENNARTSLDAWVHALYPGLSGDKRASIVARAMQVAREDVQVARTNPNLHRPPEPKPRDPDPDSNLPVGKFAQAVIRHAADTSAYGQEVDEHVARSAIAHGRVSCRGKVPVPATEADLVELRRILNSPEGKRFRGVLATASSEWGLLIAQWKKVDAAIELGEMSVAVSHAGLAQAKPATRKSAPKKPPAGKPAAKKPPAGKPRTTPQAPAKKGR